VNHSYILEQNHDSLQGKLERVVDLGEYQLGYPWWVLHTDYDDCLVVYQVLKLDQPPDENSSVGKCKNSQLIIFFFNNNLFNYLLFI
jgi:hypothetical protein